MPTLSITVRVMARINIRVKIINMVDKSSKITFTSIVRIRVWARVTAVARVKVMFRN